jgi:hypothetical protein
MTIGIQHLFVADCWRRVAPPSDAVGGDTTPPNRRWIRARSPRAISRAAMGWRMARIRAGLRRSRDFLRQRGGQSGKSWEVTSGGAGWIDEIADRARARSIHGGPLVIGHADWRVEHLRFSGARISASYDWDSILPLHETEFVGITAPSYTTDWTSYAPGRVPTVRGRSGFRPRLRNRPGLRLHAWRAVRHLRNGRVRDRLRRSLPAFTRAGIRSRRLARGLLAKAPP